MTCKHPCWLDLRFRHDEAELVKYNKLDHYKVPPRYGTNQTPSLCTVFVGKTFNKIMGASRTKLAKHDIGWITLHDISTKNSQPILLASYNSKFAEGKNSKVIGTCHDVACTPLPWYQQYQNSSDLLNTEAIRTLLFPFSDIFCLFADDFDGIEGVIRELETCGFSYLGADEVVKPRLIVMSSNPNPELELQWFSSWLSDSGCSGAFSNSIIHHFNPEERGKKELILNIIRSEAEIVQRQRREHHLAFSFSHFQELFDHACDHFSKLDPSTFNLVEASRIRNPPSGELHKHISALLNIATCAESDVVASTSIIASALTLDSCPPGSHGFDPNIIFNTFYRTPCSTAIILSSTSDQESLIELIAIKFRSFHGAIYRSNNPKSALEIHKKTLSNYRNFCAALQSNITCFICLSRRPDVRFPCGHSCCEVCFTLFGYEDPHEKYAFSLIECVLCRSHFHTEMKLKLKPPTAGVRILSLDGGGIRGIIPLQFLRVLENSLGLPHPVQDNFDIAFGTSSGGLIILGLLMNGWTVRLCEKKFVALAKQAFTPRATIFPILKRFWSIIISFLADSRYSESGIEGAVQQAFGFRSLLDFSYANRVGCKVGVTATTATKYSPCIFSNYGANNKSAGYSTIRPAKRDILIWEAARCTSAAPWFFKTHNIPGVGSFQDGGLWKNNPVDVAEWESRWLWPLVNPDLVLSLGTGTPPTPITPNSPMFASSTWKGRFFSRLYQSFMFTMDGQKAWRELWNRLSFDVRNRYVRLNTRLEGKEPDLDDVAQLPRLKNIAMNEISSTANLHDVVEQLFASLFYLELDSYPIFRRGKYICSGKIWGRLNSKSQSCSVIFQRLREERYRFFIGESDMKDVKSLELDNIAVTFSVPNLKYIIHVSMGTSRSTARHISGSPTSVQALISLQGLHCNFGNISHHRKRPGAKLKSPPSKKRKIT